MGCDIHIALERYFEGNWHYYRPKDECPYYYEYDWKPDPATGQPMQYWRVDANGNRIRSKWDKCKTRLPGIFEDRNYATFAVLANVRNDDDNPYPYIQEYRGLPFDITVGAMRFTGTESDGDLHSQGWVTLRELQEFSFTQLVPVNDYDFVTKTSTTSEEPIACRVPLIQMIEYMEAIVPIKGGTPDHVRLVFSFDN